MDPKLSKNWRKAEPRLQDLPTANLGRISDPQVAIRPSSPAPEDAAVWLHPAAVLPAPQIANLWRAPEPEIATQRYLTYIKKCAKRGLVSRFLFSNFNWLSLMTVVSYYLW